MISIKSSRRVTSFSARKTAILRALLATIFILQFARTPVFAQMMGTTMTTPGIAATTPLGITTGAPFTSVGVQPQAMGPSPGTTVMPTGIPLGATELTSPGLSPMFNSAAATAATGMPELGTTCPTSSQPTGLSGMSAAQSSTSGLSTFDGGGMSPGVTPSSIGSTSTCAASLTSTAPSTTRTANIAGGTVAQTGIPLDSVQLRNAGVSHLVPVPAPTNSTLIYQPTIPTIGLAQ